jgi:hypothetical protein
VYARRALPFLSALLFACPSSDDGGDDVMTERDGGPAPVVCTPPAGGGIQVDCDPTTGNGCDVASNQSCLWLVDMDEGECGCLSAAPAAVGAACTGVNGCVGGATCLALSGDPAMCHQVCHVPNNTGCEAVKALNPTVAYTCAPLRTAMGSATEDFGVCFAVGTACDLLAPNCGAGSRCGLVGRASACLPDDGSAGIGDPCSEAATCAAGGVCVPLVDANGMSIPPTCYEPCDVASPQCFSGGQCTEVGLPAGLCLG